MQILFACTQAYDHTALQLTTSQDSRNSEKVILQKSTGYHSIPFLHIEVMKKEKKHKEKKEKNSITMTIIIIENKYYLQVHTVNIKHALSLEEDTLNQSKMPALSDTHEAQLLPYPDIGADGADG